jgi:hypothetical protein
VRVVEGVIATASHQKVWAVPADQLIVAEAGLTKEVREVVRVRRQKKNIGRTAHPEPGEGGKAFVS